MEKPKMTKARFGLVGCGRIGVTGDDRAKDWPYPKLWLPYSHASAIQAAGGELAAVCDVDRSAAEEAARRFSVTGLYTDVPLMLEQESLDILSIATRTKDRPHILRLAVKRGVKGFYCEKPLCNSLEEGDALVKLLTELNIAFVYGSQRRYMPCFHSLLAEIKNGRIGELEEIAIRWSAGPLLWRHPHSVDLAFFLAGDESVAEAAADLELDSASVRGQIIDADPVVRSAWIRFRSGLKVSVVSDDANAVEIRGSKGSFLVKGDGANVTLRTSSGEENFTVAGGPSGTVRAMQGLIESVVQRKATPYKIQNAVANQEVLFAWVESALQGGKAISFPLARRGYAITGRTGDKLA